MDIRELPIPGAKLLRPKVFGDARGFFLETYSAPRYREAGIVEDFVQDNHSKSAKGTLRGLHYQSSPGQAKLLRVASGRIFDVIVDLRADSPTFGKWHGEYLDAEEHLQIFVPNGCAHGFCVVSDSAEVLYKVSSPYDPRTECAIRWNDPTLGVAWPLREPVLSARDQSSESFVDYQRRLGGERP